MQEVEPQDDGSAVVRYRVADPGWLVAHVLRYGPDAKVMEAAGLRKRVRVVGGRLLG